jgi:hypothetical protein
VGSQQGPEQFEEEVYSRSGYGASLTLSNIRYNGDESLRLTSDCTAMQPDATTQDAKTSCGYALLMLT